MFLLIIILQTSDENVVNVHRNYSRKNPFDKVYEKLFAIKSSGCGEYCFSNVIKTPTRYLAVHCGRDI